MKAVLSFYRTMMNGRSASISSAFLFYVFLSFLLAHHIHITSHNFHRENALKKDTLEQILASYKDLIFFFTKSSKKIFINIEICSMLQHDLSFLTC